MRAASPFSPNNGGMSLSPTNNMELEVEWNAAQVSADLKKACEILSSRGLKLASKWAAELWMGLPTIEALGISQIGDELVMKEKSPQVHYAKSLMELGEYANAAAILSQPVVDKRASIECMPPPLLDLSPTAFYLRAYALYMAGERRKEEEYHELKSDSQKQKGATNPYLQQLLNELQDSYEANELDAFGLHVYGMVILANQPGPASPDTPPAEQVLMQSVLQFPHNWSAWLDLADCAFRDTNVERKIERDIQPVLAGHYMYHFFCAHLQAEHQAYHEALQIYERWMDPALFGNSPYLLTQYGVVHYHLRQFQQASRLLEDVHQQMPYRLDSMDVYSNILYVQEDSVALSQLAHAAVQVDKYRAETCCIVGNFYSLKQQRAKAIQYFQRAISIDRSFTSAWTLMGHEYVEWKQTANAMEAYRRALQVAPNDYRAWYGLGQTYEFLSMYMYALYYYKKAAALRPYDARMWCALGMTYVQLHRTDDAIRSYERALQQDDSEGVATQKLAALYKERGNDEKAAQCYMRHLELRHQVTHPSSAAGLGKKGSLDAFLQGLVVEGPEAEALLYLADYHRRHAEYDTAALFCSRLLEYPGPEKEQAKALLRELRWRRTIHTRSQGPVDFAFSP